MVCRIKEMEARMNTEEFGKLKGGLANLTPNQRRQIKDHIHAVEQQQAVHLILESRVIEHPVCPYCGEGSVARWGTASGLQRYRCVTCKHTFNALTGTPLAGLRHKEVWLSYAEQMVQGQSVRRSAEACGVHRNTAFRWRHRFLSLPNGQQPSRLEGIVEADETFFLESFKGKKKGIPRASRKRGGKAKKPGLSDEQIPVLICRDRGGQTADAVLKKINSEEVGKVIRPILAKDSMLCADGSSIYVRVARELDVPLKAVNVKAGIRVVEQIFHVQNVNAYDSRLKTWMRRFHGVATAYLSNYLGWRRLLDHFRSTVDPKVLLRAALGITYLQQAMVT